MNVTELVQTKRDLGRTQYAERLKGARRAMKNTSLQSGGLLKVAEGRHIARKKVESELEKARRLVQAAEEKERKAAKRWFQEAAKKAWKWWLTGILRPAEIYDEEHGRRLLKRYYIIKPGCVTLG